MMDEGLWVLFFLGVILSEAGEARAKNLEK